jgi:hypothetical protein
MLWTRFQVTMSVDLIHGPFPTSYGHMQLQENLTGGFLKISLIIATEVVS